jgi:hypothetical protein
MKQWGDVLLVEQVRKKHYIGNIFGRSNTIHWEEQKGISEALRGEEY